MEPNRDIHELKKRANEKLKENEILQNDFIHIAAHELKTPLQPILMMSEIIKAMINQNDSDKTDGQIKVNRVHLNELLDIIIRNTNKLSKLTNNVLDITRIESGDLRLEKELIDMKKFLIESIDDYNKQYNIKSNKYLTNSREVENLDKTNHRLRIGKSITNNTEISRHQVPQT